MTGLETKVGVYSSFVSDKMGQLHGNIMRRLLRGAEVSVEDLFCMKDTVWKNISSHIPMTHSSDKNLHGTGSFLKVFSTFRLPFRSKVLVLFVSQLWKWRFSRIDLIAFLTIMVVSPITSHFVIIVTFCDTSQTL